MAAEQKKSRNRDGHPHQGASRAARPYKIFRENNIYQFYDKNLAK
jgi:hypothetical protein